MGIQMKRKQLTIKDINDSFKLKKKSFGIHG